MSQAPDLTLDQPGTCSPGQQVQARRADSASTVGTETDDVHNPEEHLDPQSCQVRLHTVSMAPCHHSGSVQKHGSHVCGRP